MRRVKLISMVTAAAVTAGAAGCASKTGTAALIGAAGGAAVGAAIGSDKGNAGKGALIGGAVGAIGGALVGNTMDQADKNKAEARAREEEQRRAQDEERARAEADARVEDEEQADETDREETADRRPAKAKRQAKAQADDEQSETSDPDYVPAPAEPAEAGVTVDDVISWWNDGKTENEILEKLVAADNDFRLTDGDVERLQKEGVTDVIINEMKESGRRATAE